MNENEATVAFITKQLEPLSDEQLGGIFRKLLIGDWHQVGLCCYFPWDKTLTRSNGAQGAYNYNQAPSFQFYNSGCGCCSSNETAEHKSLLDALQELVKPVI